jgi:hypothetical protein
VKIVAFRDTPNRDWDRTYASSSQAWLFHSADWVAIEESFFVGRNLSFALVDRGLVVGIQPLYLSDARSGTGGESLLHSAIHRHTGLAFSNHLPAKAIAAARGAAMTQIFALAEEHRCDRIQLNAHNLTPENRSARRNEIPFWVTRCGFHLGLAFGPQGLMAAPGMATCNADQIVDLEKDEQILFAALDQGCRNAVRQGMRNALRLLMGEESSAIDRYYELAQISAERTGEALPPIEYYREIWRRLQPTGRCAVLFAYDGNRAAAAVFLLIDKGAASYLAGASDPRLLEKRPNNFIHWRAILWARERGLTHYRLGPVFPEVPPEWPIARVSRFKSEFGARSVTVIQGSYFRRPERYLEAAIAQLRQLVVQKSTNPGLSCTSA